MATRSFVNLDPYEAAILQQRARQVSPLDAALQSVQQGIQIQQLPQTLQDQALQRQLNNALLQEKLISVQNPNEALARELQKIAITEAVKNPLSGIIQTPAGAVGEVIATPQAIPQTAIGLEQALTANPAMSIPTAAPTLPIVPLGTGVVQTGLSQDLNVPAQAVEDKLEGQIRLANARIRSTNPTVKGQFIPDGFGGMVFAQFPTAPGGEVQTSRVTTPEGQDIKVVPKTASARGLTDGQRTALLARAGKAGVNPNDFAREDGTFDYDKMAIASGTSEKKAADDFRKAKLEAIPAELRSKAAGYLAVQKDLENLKTEMQDLQAKGGVPGILDNAIASATAGAPTGFWSNLYRAGLQSFQSADSREFEGSKARVSTALTNMISGAAVPDSERKFLTPFLPFPGESLESVLAKISGLEEYLNNRITTFSPSTGGDPVAPASAIKINSIRLKK